MQGHGGINGRLKRRKTTRNSGRLQLKAQTMSPRGGTSAKERKAAEKSIRFMRWRRGLQTGSELHKHHRNCRMPVNWTSRDNIRNIGGGITRSLPSRHCHQALERREVRKAIYQKNLKNPKEQKMSTSGLLGSAAGHPTVNQNNPKIFVTHRLDDLSQLRNCPRF